MEHLSWLADHLSHTYGELRAFVAGPWALIHAVAVGTPVALVLVGWRRAAALYVVGFCYVWGLGGAAGQVIAADFDTWIRFALYLALGALLALVLGNLGTRPERWRPWRRRAGSAYLDVGETGAARISKRRPPR